MNYILLGLTGLFGGVLGGMGMGGGTILIPLLSIAFSIPQKVAQCINLLAFIPMAIVALIIHIKNGLIEFKCLFLTVISGLISCLVASKLAMELKSEYLRKGFGVFLIILSVYQLFSCIKKDKS